MRHHTALLTLATLAALATPTAADDHLPVTSDVIDDPSTLTDPIASIHCGVSFPGRGESGLSYDLEEGHVRVVVDPGPAPDALVDFLGRLGQQAAGLASGFGISVDGAHGGADVGFCQPKDDA